MEEDGGDNNHTPKEGKPVLGFLRRQLHFKEEVSGRNSSFVFNNSSFVAVDVFINSSVPKMDLMR